MPFAVKFGARSPMSRADAWLVMPLFERVVWLGVGVAGGGAVYGAVVYGSGVRPADLTHRV